MSDELIYLPDLETAFAAVYRGPLEEFIGRRDALAKQLRATKRRAEADRAKALRKPSRIAWVLDSAVHDDPTAIERLAAAVTAAVDAQTAGAGDLRVALDGVRAAAREFAEAAARVAAKAGHPTEASTLSPAVMAVIGDASAFAALRSGQLADIPDAGGLDFLAAAPPVRAATPSPATSPTVTKEIDADDVARAQLQRAEALLTQATERADAANRTLADAQARMESAEQQLRRAQDEVAGRRADLERAREDAKKAVAQHHDAKRAIEEARTR